MVFHCYFYLHFPDDIQYGTSFHMLISHLSRKCLFISITHLLIYLNFKCCLYTLENSYSSDVSFVNAFSQSVTCHLILLIMFFIW